jgi:hypothetical protein
VAEPEPAAVVVAYVHQNEVAYSWHHSMTELLGWDWANHGRVLRGGYIGMRFGSDGLVQARNQAVRHFLEDGKAEWLFWIDTDMGFAPDTVDRLLEAADPVERPMVGGLCFTQTEKDADGIGGWRCAATPTVFDWAKLDSGQMGFAVRWDFTPDALTRVGGTGSACILIHRSVFERIEAAHGRVWYDRVPNITTGQLLGEDLSFCLRAGALGVPMFVHTGVRTTHLKATWLAEEDYWQQRALMAMRPTAAPATERTAVIVPVLGRPQNAAPFMESLKASGADLATVWAVAGTDDKETADAWASAGANVLTAPLLTFAEKVNFGYGATAHAGPWLFLVGDDVRFRPGWLDHAQAAARDGFDVIGTNDLHNPRVTTGEHGTHLLIRRSYVDEQGSSWDGPKVVAHEGFRHWYVDDEIVTAAKQRGTWTSAPRSVVEHLHPLWGNATDDDTYRLGRSSAEQDRALFEERLAEHAGG